MHDHRKPWPAAVIAFLLAMGVATQQAGALSSEAADAWLNDFEEIDTSDVNDGELAFLAEPPQEAVHAHHNRIRLTSQSLEDGWAELQQCHINLDPVPSAQVVFRSGRIRDLRVVSVIGIERAWVEGHTVQLNHVVPGAELCLAAESRVVEMAGEGGFVVRNGPFMRRFLDGYYPLHVALVIEYPPGDWVLAGSSPASQPGFEVRVEPERLSVDAWFEGKLRTEFRFAPLVSNDSK